MASKIPVVVTAGQLEQLQDADNLGALRTTSITASALTSGRVPFVSTNGLLVDDADLTFNGTTLSSKSLNLVATSSSTVGVIKQGAANLINTYADPTADGYNVFIGSNAGNFTLSPAGGASSLASRNFAIGAFALPALTTGAQNIGLGVYACGCITTGGENLGIGYSAVYSATTAWGNVGVGVNALGVVTGSHNVGIGYYAGYRATGNSGVFIGKQAGYYETGSGKLFIDNAPRSNEADARIKAMVYGVFASTAVAQDLVFNAQVGINISPTAWLTLPAGSATAGTAPLKLTGGTLTTVVAAGQVEYDGKRFYITGGSTRRVISRGSDAITSAVTVANTTVETTAFTAAFPANTLAAGKVYKVSGYGKASTHNASATLTVRLKTGGTTLATLACTPGAAANDPVICLLIGTIRTIGASGTISAFGKMQIKGSDTSTNTSSFVIDTTALINITVTFQWDAAHTGNTVTLDQCFLELNN